MAVPTIAFPGLAPVKADAGQSGQTSPDTTNPFAAILASLTRGDARGEETAALFEAVDDNAAATGIASVLPAFTAEQDHGVSARAVDGTAIPEPAGNGQANIHVAALDGDLPDVSVTSSSHPVIDIPDTSSGNLSPTAAFPDTSAPLQEVPEVPSVAAPQSATPESIETPEAQPAETAHHVLAGARPGETGPAIQPEPQSRPQQQTASENADQHVGADAKAGSVTPDIADDDAPTVAAADTAITPSADTPSADNETAQHSSPASSPAPLASDVAARTAPVVSAGQSNRTIAQQTGAPAAEGPTSDIDTPIAGEPAVRLVTPATGAREEASEGSRPNASQSGPAQSNTIAAANTQARPATPVTSLNDPLLSTGDTGPDAVTLVVSERGVEQAAAQVRSTQQTSGANLPSAQIAVAVAAQARAGNTRFEIRLDPPEMGRIDVRLELTRDGGVTAHMTVDRPETLDALNRDARHLERLLQQSGLKVDGGGIQFSLRDQGNGEGGNDGDRQMPQASDAANPDIAEQAPTYRMISPTALVDIEI